MNEILPETKSDPLRKIMTFMTTAESQKKKQLQYVPAEAGIGCMMLGVPLELSQVMGQNNHRFDLLYEKRAFTHLYDTIEHD